jgi:preprotein translocase subunit SecY
MNARLQAFISNLPSVPVPEEKLSLRTKFGWTFAILLLFVVMSFVPLFGVSKSYSLNFEILQVLIASHFGSLISLGIGPIVSASIIIQMLQGTDIIHIDTSTKEGRIMFQGIQKLAAVAFVAIENGVYVFSGALAPAGPGLAFPIILFVQLILAGIVLIFMDEVVSKWGIGSGISLFILAGIALQLVNTTLNPFGSFPGAIPQIISAFMSGAMNSALLPIVSIISTVALFAVAIWLQGVKVELPLSFGRLKGYAIRWPVALFYTSIIPIVLVVSLVAGVQFFAMTLYNMGNPILGTFTSASSPLFGNQQIATGGLAALLSPPTLQQLYVSATTTGITSLQIESMAVYTLILIFGAAAFSYIWMYLGAQDPKSVARKLMDSGLSMPGFRRDERVITDILKRYILPLAIIGGALTGLVAALATFLNALTAGIGILLVVMIIYQFYNSLMQDNAAEFRPIKEKLTGETFD